MQASLNELAEILAERQGRQYDIPFREEMKVMINYWRARLIVDSLNSRPKDRKFFTKWLEIPLEQVNESEFAEYPDCPVLRTVCKIPKAVRANSKEFDFVGKLNKRSVISMHEPHLIEVLNSSEYTGKNIRGALINDYIYVYNELNLPGIAVNMIPESIEEFKDCCLNCDTCFTDDEPYPVSADLQQRIIQAILGTELRAVLSEDPKSKEVENEQQERSNRA